MRWLAPALSRMTLFLVQELDRRRRYGLVDVTTAQTSAVGAVPVPFDDHRAATAGATSGQRIVHRGHPSKPGAGAWPDLPVRATGYTVGWAFRLPAGLAAGFGLKAVLRATNPSGGRTIHPDPRRADAGSPVLAPAEKREVRPPCLSADGARHQTRTACDFRHILRLQHNYCQSLVMNLQRRDRLSTET
jgi:hypothetical protein